MKKPINAILFVFTALVLWASPALTARDCAFLEVAIDLAASQGNYADADAFYSI